MIKLSKQITDINQELEVRKNNEEHEVALASYVSILKELHPLLEGFRADQENKRILENELGLHVNPVDLDERNKQLTKVVSLFSELKKSWVENDYGVKQKNELPAFKTAFGSYAESLRGDYKKIFQGWLDEELSGSLTKAQLDAQRKIANLKSYADKYAENYSILEKWAKKSSMPTREEARQLLSSSEAMGKAQEKMNFDDWPDSVRAFFTAVSNNQAPLSMLTAEVVEWLKEHGQYDDYVVRRKVTSFGR